MINYEIFDVLESEDKLEAQERAEKEYYVNDTVVEEVILFTIMLEKPGSYIEELYAQAERLAHCIEEYAITDEFFSYIIDKERELVEEIIESISPGN